VNATTFRLFYGTVESVTLTRQLPLGAVADARIVASDLLTLLAQDRIYAQTITAGVADDMVKEALGYVSWTAGAYTTTNVTAASLALQAYVCSGVSILETIQTIARSEGFVFYVVPGNRTAQCWLVDPWDKFSISATLDETDLTSVILSCDADQIATIVRVTAQPNDVGDAVYDKTDGTYESMWTLASHGLTTAQEVWFSAAGGGAEPFEPDTHYFAIAKSSSIFQLATSAVNASAGTYIGGTGDDSSDEWTLRVAGAQQTAQHPADHAAYGEWPVTHSGSLVATDTAAATMAHRDLDRRQKLFRLLRPTSMTTKIAVGETWHPDRMELTQPFSAITLTLDLQGAARSYTLYVQGGSISQRPGAPLTVTAYTEASDQWET
jgi:hypothetical protein